MQQQLRHVRFSFSLHTSPSCSRSADRYRGSRDKEDISSHRRRLPARICSKLRSPSPPRPASEDVADPWQQV